MRYIGTLFLLLISTITAEEHWVTLPLAESYEYRIVEEKGVPTLDEYRELFKDRLKGWTLKRELMTFDNEEELKSWVAAEVAPHFPNEDKERFVEAYLERMKEKGWLDYGDGKIRFPRKQLVVLIT